MLKIQIHKFYKNKLLKNEAQKLISMFLFISIKVASNVRSLAICLQLIIKIKNINFFMIFYPAFSLNLVITYLLEYFLNVFLNLYPFSQVRLFYQFHLKWILIYDYLYLKFAKDCLLYLLLSPCLPQLLRNYIQQVQQEVFYHLNLQLLVKAYFQSSILVDQLLIQRYVVIQCFLYFNVFLICFPQKEDLFQSIQVLSCFYQQILMYFLQILL